MTTPPRVGSASLGRPHRAARLAWRFRGLKVQGVADVTRLMTMSIVDILDRFFESDQVKTVMALNGLIGTWAGPHEPGTGYVMAHHSIGDVGDGHVGAWATRDRRDGRGGRRPRVERPVPRRRDPHRGAGRPDPHAPAARVRGVALASGEELRAPIVVAATHPQITFLRQLDASELPDAFVRRHPELAVAQRHGEDQPGARPRARVHRPNPTRPT